jgi:hypothetical protein
MTALLHAVGLYLALALVAASSWGLGASCLRLDRASRASSGGVTDTVASAVGLGVLICGLQWLAVAGFLRAWTIAILLALGASLFFLQVVRLRRSDVRATDGAPAPDGKRAATFAQRCAWAALLLLGLPTLLAPLAPPLAWDEVMYHLPHAREWATNGQLSLNEWLRYPWFPYNFDLLFSAALIFGSDVLPHLLHGLAGWLTALLIYQLGARHLDRIQGCIAAMLWVWLSKGEYDQAYIDMGVALFVLAAGAAFALWQPSRDRRWIAAGAFCLGVAAGAKYQALGVLPLFAAALALRDRRPATWLVALTAFALPCTYWYVRNALATGDPIAPIGGPLFGFTDWNAEDYKVQFDDLRRNIGWPSALLLPALATPAFRHLRNHPALRIAMLASVYFVVVWALTSRYPRYLMFAYPALALVAAAGWVQLFREAQKGISALRSPRLLQTGAALAVACCLLFAAFTSARYLRRVALTDDARAAVLKSKVPGYAVLAYLRAHPARKVYQMGLEDSIYYGPQRMWGDVFGPWRYRDFTELAPADLHKTLRQQDFDALLVHTERMPHVATRAGFEQHFHLVHTDGTVRLYRLAQASPP